MPAKNLHDDEFGEITLRRVSRGRAIKISLNKHGKLQATIPRFASLRQVKSLINNSRDELREIISSANITIYKDGTRIGKSHYITVKCGAQNLSVTRKAPLISVQIPNRDDITSLEVQSEISKHVKNALRYEAKKYLTKRIEILARQHGYRYQRLAFMHAKTRWGSCTSRGTINLNIALMNLPFELIDYVLIHELCHTKQMNHSAEFWCLVERADPHYKAHRAAMKNHSPII